MKSYFNFFQPTIVKSSELEDIPESLRGKYFVNLNIVGIKWFVNNFLLIEDGNGGYLYMLTNDAHKIRLNQEWEEVIDIPRAYIVLTDDFVASQESFSTWILSSITDNSFFITGTEDFKPGVDYYINETLKKYLMNYESDAVDIAGLSDCVLHNYLSSEFDITKWWQDLSDSKARSNDFMWLLNKNKARDIGWTEEELEHVLHCFFETIYNGTSITPSILSETKNQIYKKVIEYMKNFKTDAGTISLQLILNTMTAASVEGVSNCSCSGVSTYEASTYSQATCLEKYQAAMEEWLQAMLGDKDFYKDWMYILADDGQGAYPDEGLIDQLISLLEALLQSGNIILTTDTQVYRNNCHCHDGSDKFNTTEEAARTAIKNYITMLGWIKDGCLDENTNKIKVIGKEFAKVITKL